MGSGVSSETYSSKDEFADALKKKLANASETAVPSSLEEDEGVSPFDRVIHLIAYLDGQGQDSAHTKRIIELIKVILMEQILESSFSSASAMVSGILKEENDEDVANLVKALAITPSVSSAGRKRSILFSRSPNSVKKKNSIHSERPIEVRR